MSDYADLDAEVTDASVEIDERNYEVPVGGSGPGRCDSAVTLNSGWHKYCIRAAKHSDRHVWIESLDAVGKDPEIYVWEGADYVNEPYFVGRIVGKLS